MRSVRYRARLIVYFHSICFAARYDRDASRYHQGVYKRKRADLIASLDSTLSPLFLGQLKNLHKSCLVQFKKEMLDGLKGEDYSFADVVAKAQQRCESRFKSGAQEAVVEGTDWSWEEEMSLLNDEIVIVGDQCRKDETKKMINLIEVSSSDQVFGTKTDHPYLQRNFKRQISEPVDLALNKAPLDLWDQVLTTFRGTLDKAENTYLAKAKSEYHQLP